MKRVAAYGAYRRRHAGVPVNTAPPQWGPFSLLIGESGALTTGTWTGTPSLSYAILRDGVAIVGPGATLEDVEAYVIAAEDIGPTLVVRETDAVSGTYADSEPHVFDDAAYLPATAIGISTAGVTTADAGATAQSWAATLGGIACTLAAVASSNRPAYSASGGAGGRPLVTFDGTDDALDGVLTKGSAWTDYEFGVVARQTADGDTSDRVITYGLGTAGSARFGINEQSSGVYRTSVASGANVSHTTAPTSALAHFSGDAAAGTINARTAGVVEGTSAGTVTSRADGESLYLGGLLLAAGCTAMECTAWYCGPALTADQRTHLRALLTYHTGVTC